MKYIKLQEDNPDIINIKKEKKTPGNDDELINFKDTTRYKKVEKIKKDPFQKFFIKVSIFYFLGFICLIVGLISGTIEYNRINNTTQPPQHHNKLKDEYNNGFQSYRLLKSFGVILFFIFHIIVIILSIHSPLYSMIKELSSNIQSLNKYHSNMIKSRVELNIISTSYHFDYKTIRKIKHGKSKTKTKKIKLVSNLETIKININQCYDLTMPLIIQDHGYSGSRKLIEVQFDRLWNTDNFLSNHLIQSTKNQLFEKNKNVDQFIDIRMELNYLDEKCIDHGLFLLNGDDQEELLGASNDNVKLPFLLSSKSFLLFTIFFLHFPYHLYYRSLILKSNINYLKIIDVSNNEFI